MRLSSLDWAIIAAFFLLSLVIGLVVTRRSSQSTSEFFLGGRSMPWWLLGVSMVATTFAIDTPNLVTGIVRTGGVAGNWVWWAFLLNGMLTVFVYARLWRRSGVQTDLEFYELRYSGPAAAFLRGFRAVYLGVFFNVMIMATVCLAAVKLGGIAFGWTPLQALLLASLITVVYSLLGGFLGVLATDLFQFVVAMIGSVGAAIYLVDLPQVGGLERLLAHPNVTPHLGLFPDFSDTKTTLAVFILPLAVQWWSVWYPGSEPGGGGYVAQRMLAAKDERHAVGATLLFNVAHYAVRPWPWILVAFASLIVYPTLGDLARAFPHLEPSLVRDDLAYPAMLSFLPSGLLGLVIASLIAAFMSTISTHLNWGSSYVVNDLYQRFYEPDASEKRLVLVGRVATAVLMLLAAWVAIYLESAMQAFEVLLSMGAGTGLIFILRWFWWRVSAQTEIAGMIVSLLVSIFFQFGADHVGLGGLDVSVRLTASVVVTTALWLLVTFLTPPTDDATLVRFYRLIRPGGPGWRRIRAIVEREDGVDAQRGAQREEGSITTGLSRFVLGTFAVYSLLLGSGRLVYGHVTSAAVLLGLGSLALAYLGVVIVRDRVDSSSDAG